MIMAGVIGKNQFMATENAITGLLAAINEIGGKHEVVNLK
jgi:hypothetical protein